MARGYTLEIFTFFAWFRSITLFHKPGHNIKFYPKFFPAAARFAKCLVTQIMMVNPHIESQLGQAQGEVNLRPPLVVGVVKE